MSNLFASGIRPAIDQYLLDEAAKVRNYGNYWSASSAGYCMRRNIFERLKVPHSAPEDARKQRVFTAGHVFHDWIQEITKANGLSIAQEVELQDEELMVRGHFDDLVLIKTPPAARLISDIPALDELDRLILYDYKTVNSRSFLWAKKNGNKMSYYHKMQIGTYMYTLRKHTDFREFYGAGLTMKLNLKDLTEARILKIEKDTLMMMEQQLLWSPQLESDVTTYWNSLNAHWKAKTLPKCTCADHENGFMAREKFNPYFRNGEPCSLEIYQEWKAAQ